MASINNDEVRVFQPDTSLKQKLGPHASFDQVVGNEAMTAAEDVIAKSSAEILAGLLEELGHLQEAAAQLKANSPGSTALTRVIVAAFSIKSSAGLCGYPFASSLAKSLHVFCELDAVRHQPLSPKSLKIIQSQIAGLKTIFANKITGDGGQVGAAILDELRKLSEDT